MKKFVDGGPQKQPSAWGVDVNAGSFYIFKYGKWYNFNDIQGIFGTDKDGNTLPISEEAGAPGFFSNGALCI